MLAIEILSVLSHSNQIDKVVLLQGQSLCPLPWKILRLYFLCLFSVTAKLFHRISSIQYQSLQFNYTLITLMQVVFDANAMTHSNNSLIWRYGKVQHTTAFWECLTNLACITVSMLIFWWQAMKQTVHALCVCKWQSFCGNGYGVKQLYWYLSNNRWVEEMEGFACIDEPAENNYVILQFPLSPWEVLFVFHFII